jgi:hypothetical protein
VLNQHIFRVDLNDSIAAVSAGVKMHRIGRFENE